MELTQLQDMVTKGNEAIQATLAKAAEEQKTQGAAMVETKATLATLTEKQTALQKQLDALDEKMQAKALVETAEVPLGEFLRKETDCERLIKTGGSGQVQFTLKGHHAARMLGLKTTMTSDNVGSTPRQTTGVLQIERDGGITDVAKRALGFRDVLATRRTSSQVVDFVKVANAMADGAIQSPEGSAKHENALTFSSVSRKVVTVASWMPCSRQILADWSELQAFIEQSISYYVRKETEDQLLNGNGAGEAIYGLLGQATAFNTALLPGAASGWTLIDIIGWAAGQVAIADELAPSWVLLNAQDLWELRMTKDSQGRYILGDPTSQGVPSIFGLRPVLSNAITAGTFLIGSSDAAANEVRSRMEIEIAIGEQHSDYFTKNLVAIRAEERLTQVTKRPASFITGSTTTSPA